MFNTSFIEQETKILYCIRMVVMFIIEGNVLILQHHSPNHRTLHTIFHYPNLLAKDQQTIMKENSCKIYHNPLISLYLGKPYIARWSLNPEGNPLRKPLFSLPNCVQPHCSESVCVSVMLLPFVVRRSWCWCGWIIKQPHQSVPRVSEKKIKQTTARSLDRTEWEVINYSPLHLSPHDMDLINNRKAIGWSHVRVSCLSAARGGAASAAALIQIRSDVARSLVLQNLPIRHPLRPMNGDKIAILVLPIISHLHFTRSIRVSYRRWTRRWHVSLGWMDVIFARVNLPFGNWIRQYNMISEDSKNIYLRSYLIKHLSNSSTKQCQRVHLNIT